MKRKVTAEIQIKNDNINLRLCVNLEGKKSFYSPRWFDLVKDMQGNEYLYIIHPRISADFYQALSTKKQVIVIKVNKEQCDLKGKDIFIKSEEIKLPDQKLIYVKTYKNKQIRNLI